MPSAKHSAAARKNIKKAAAAAKRERTIAHLPNQAAKVRKSRPGR
jgi:hypothetical protein